MRQIDGKYKTSGDLTKLDGTPIPEDEPLILFRGHDKLLPALLEHYQKLCQDAGSPNSHLESLKTKIDQVKAWQSQNLGSVKTPD